MKRDKSKMILATVLLVAMSLGCSNESNEPNRQSSGPGGKGGAALPDGLLLAAEPAGATGVVAALAAAKDGDKVTVRGRVGGRKEPFAAQRATMMLVDLSLPYCGQNKTEDCCTEPWDYCCEPQERLSKHLVSVQVDGADGKILHTGLKGAGGVKELSEVVVLGILRADAMGGKTVHATGIYVAQE